MRLFAKVDGTLNKYDRVHYFGDIFSLRFHNEFPTLSRAASFKNFSQDSAHDPTIRSEFENGTVLTRARFTTIKKRWSGITYNLLTAADKTLLENLQTSTKIGAAPFFWTNPEDDTEYDVRLTEPIKFRIEPRRLDKFEARLSIVEE